MGEKRVIEQVASNVVHNDDWFLKDSPTQDTSKISATNLKAILGADGTLALDEIANAIAEEYDSTHTYYNTGLVFHEGVLYQCTATSVTGTWDSTKWNVVDIKDLLDNVSTNIGYLWNIISNTIAGNYDTSSTYNTGDYVIYSLKLYRCKDDGVTGAWNSSKWDEVNIPEYIDYVLENAGIVKDVKVDGTSVVNEQGEAEIEIPVKDVQVKTDSTYDSVVDASGNAKIDLSSVTAYGSVPNLPQPIATFKDGADAPMKSLKVAIEPQQDLHGYDSPWVGGAGKNKLENATSLGTRTINGVTITTREDGSLLFNGTSTGGVNFIINSNVQLPDNTYILSTDTTMPTNSIIAVNTSDGNKSTRDSVTFTGSVNGNVWIYVGQEGVVFNNLIIKPMIRLASVSDVTFAPYSNICPISGWDEVNVGVNNGNWWDEEYQIYGSGATARIGSKNPIPCKPNTTYYITKPPAYGWKFYDKDMNVLATYYNQTYTTPSNCYYMLFQLDESYGTTYNNDVCINTISTDYYTPYNGQTYTIELDGTRYGGVVDVVNGIVTPAPYYASYNGETLTGEWISDRDKYEVGATPTIGAQVVNIGASGTPVSMLPTAVKSLRGVNNAYANTGNVNKCVYRRDMSFTIDDIIARLEALEG